MLLAAALARRHPRRASPVTQRSTLIHPKVPGHPLIPWKPCRRRQANPLYTMAIEEMDDAVEAAVEPNVQFQGKQQFFWVTKATRLLSEDERVAKALSLIHI